MAWFLEFLYGLTYLFCFVLDTISSVFRKLAGVEKMTTTSGEEVEDLLTYFLMSATVTTIFFAVLLIAILLILIFAIVAIIRARLQPNPAASQKQAVKSCVKGVLSFAVIPILVLAGVFACNGIVKALDVATSGGGDSISLGGRIVAFSIDITEDSLWRDGTACYGQYIENGVVNEGVKQKRTEFVDSVVAGKYKWTDLSNALEMKKYNQWLPLVGAGACMVMFAMSALPFVFRIYRVVVLFATGAVVASTTSLDDGERFAKWRQTLLTEIVSAYSILIVMNIFLMFSNLIFDLKFVENAFSNSIVQLLFLIGGAVAVYTSTQLIQNFINSENATTVKSSETNPLATAGGTVAAAGTGAAVGGHAFRAASGAVANAGKRSVLGAKIAGTATAAGITGIASKLTHGKIGGKAHTKFMTNLQGNKYKQKMQARSSQNAERERHVAAGLSMKQVKRKEKMYSNMFKKIEKQEKNNAKNGLMGKWSNKKES